MPVLIKPAKNGEIYYTVTGNNNETLVHSETEKTMVSILKSIEALKEQMNNVIIKDQTKDNGK